MLKKNKLIIILISILVFNYSYSQNLQVKKKDLHIFLESFIYQIDKKKESDKFSNDISCFTNKNGANVCILTSTFSEGIISIRSYSIVVSGIYFKKKNKMLIHYQFYPTNNERKETYFSCKLPLLVTEYYKSCKGFLDEEDAIDDINKNL